MERLNIASDRGGVEDKTEDVPIGEAGELVTVAGEETLDEQEANDVTANRIIKRINIRLITLLLRYPIQWLFPQERYVQYQN